MTSVTRRALTGSGLLLAAVMVVNILNYGYALVLGRLLGPGGYGTYASFVAVFLLLNLWPLTLQQVAAQSAASGRQVEGFLRPLGAWSGVALGLLLAVTAHPVAAALQLPWGWVLGLAAMLPFFTLTGVLRGEAQGHERFVPMGLNLVLEHLGKILLTPLTLWAVPASAAAVATLAAFPLTTAHLYRRRPMPPVPLPERRAALRLTGPAFANLAAQAVIMNADVLIVRAFLPAREAGLYAAASIIGRVVFYGAWAVSTALFPMMVARRGAQGGALLTISLALTAAVGGGVTLLCAAMPQPIMSALFGAAYQGGAFILAPYALITTLYALSNAVVSHALAQSRRGHAALVAVMAAAQLTALLLNHGSVWAVLVDQLVAQGVLLVLVLVLLRFQPVRPVEEAYVLQ